MFSNQNQPSKFLGPVPSAGFFRILPKLLFFDPSIVWSVMASSSTSGIQIRPLLELLLSQERMENPTLGRLKTIKVDQTVV
jgi:hypothetical protein